MLCLHFRAIGVHNLVRGSGRSLCCMGHCGGRQGMMVREDDEEAAMHSNIEPSDFERLPNFRRGICRTRDRSGLDLI